MAHLPLFHLPLVSKATVYSAYDKKYDKFVAISVWSKTWSHFRSRLVTELMIQFYIRSPTPPNELVRLNQLRKLQPRHWSNDLIRGCRPSPDVSCIKVQCKRHSIHLLSQPFFPLSPHPFSLSSFLLWPCLRCSIWAQCPTFCKVTSGNSVKGYRRLHYYACRQFHLLPSLSSSSALLPLPH